LPTNLRTRKCSTAFLFFIWVLKFHSREPCFLCFFLFFCCLVVRNDKRNYSKLIRPSKKVYNLVVFRLLPLLSFFSYLAFFNF
jgi:hypothetical protein